MACKLILYGIVLATLVNQASQSEVYFFAKSTLLSDDHPSSCTTSQFHAINRHLLGIKPLTDNSYLFNPNITYKALAIIYVEGFDVDRFGGEHLTIELSTNLSSPLSQFEEHDHREMIITHRAGYSFKVYKEDETQGFDLEASAQVQVQHLKDMNAEIRKHGTEISQLNIPSAFYGLLNQFDAISSVAERRVVEFEAEEALLGLRDVLTEVYGDSLVFEIVVLSLTKDDLRRSQQRAYDRLHKYRTKYNVSYFKTADEFTLFFFGLGVVLIMFFALVAILFLMAFDNAKFAIIYKWKDGHDKND